MLRYFWLTILLLPLSLLAQPPLLFNDEFTALRPHWPQLEGEQAIVKDGQLILKQGEPTGVQRFTLEQYLSFRDNFILETQLTFAETTPDAQVGILWAGNRRGTEYYALLTRPDQTFCLIEVKNGKRKVLRDWQKGKLKKAGKPNEIRLIRQQWSLYVELNGKEELRMDFMPFKGIFHGFLIEGRSEVAVDFFRIYHPEIRIPTVSDVHARAIRFPLDTPINMPGRHELAPIVSQSGRGIYYSVADTNRGPEQASRAVAWQGDSGWVVSAPVMPPHPPRSHEEWIRFSGNGKEAIASLFERNGKGQLLILKGRDSSWLQTGLEAFIDLPEQKYPISYHFTADRMTVVLAAELPGGEGNRDLWISEKAPDGSWSQPKNLGKAINSFGDETAPFLDPKTGDLYFSSDARAGYGGYDFYRSKRLGKRWTQWAQPLNLGEGLNGPGDELGYRPMPGRPRRIFFAASTSRDSDFDLYQTLLPIDYTKRKLVRVRGTVRHAFTREPIPGSTIIAARIRTDSLETVRSLKLNPDSSAYEMLVPFGTNYQLFAEHPGFYPKADTLNLRSVEAYQLIERDLFLLPIEAGSTITLEKVLFKRARAELIDSSYADLSQLFRLMRDNPSLEIEIRGHTDNIGEPTVLQTLSEARAERVRQYLLERGIAATRVTSRGFGATEPVADNSDPVTRRLNRRVEFQIVKM